jgi:transposase-like protein
LVALGHDARPVTQRLVLNFINTVTYFVPGYHESGNLCSAGEHAMPRQSPYDIKLSKAERAELLVRSRCYTSRYRDVVRAKIVLLASEGMANDAIAARLDTPRQIVSKWRRRFHIQRLAGLEEQPRGGRPARFSPQCRGRDQGPGL